ncbi:MAG: N-acetyltransferase [Gammaproteobacteria bacterium]|nr:N-acetyltransferase [Gammaproteobacteria bacterium]
MSSGTASHAGATRAVASIAPIVRPAAIGDVPYIHHLLEIYAAQGNLLPRTMNELYRHLRDFFVIDVDGKVAACGALEIFTDSLGEVRSLVVDDEFKGRGFGRMLVERIAEEARAIGLKRLMALTYVAPFFHKLGFKTVAKDTLPEKVWSVCVKCYKFNSCDETAVLLEIK